MFLVCLVLEICCLMLLYATVQKYLAYNVAVFVSVQSQKETTVQNYCPDVYCTVALVLFSSQPSPSVPTTMASASLESAVASSS